MTESGAEEPGRLSPAEWAELSPLVDEVLDAPIADRAALIARLCVGRPERHAALARLVADDARGLPLLDGDAVAHFDSLTADASGALLPDLVAERYRTGREIGHGGMARVYLAHDAKHGRDVAIKVIRPELAESLGHDRFLREIEIASRLRHPNIVPLYDSGEVNGALYFVMPYEAGPSLRERLRTDGRLPIAESLSILRDVARALAHAHEHGVVHRDVKPDNIMLSGDAAVVTDFGIAKAVSAALNVGREVALTQTGSGIGTPAYMAPEQAIGDPATDHRADIYAFGCVAYELLAGQPPFTGKTAHEIVAGHMATAPRPLRELRPEVPVAVEAMVSACLQKRAEDRPQSVRELLSLLDGVATSGGATGASMRSLPARGSGSRRWMMAAVALLVLASAGFFVFRSTARAAPITLAVLPFGNSAADSSVEFVAEGLSDELAASLTQVPGLQIKSRAGARMYRGQLGPDVAEAGARLKADYLMTGVVRQERGRWILSVDLARASDATSLWAQMFTLNPDEQAGAVPLIARSLLAALRSNFPRSIGADAVVAVARQTANNEAYRLFLRGQEKLNRRGLSVEASAELFRQAIREDSLFARAWSGLSMSLALFPYFQGVPAGDVQAEVARAAQRALALDPTLAQPHVAMGLVHQFRFQWDSAEAEFQTAVAHDTHDVEARVQYARHLMFRGRTSEAMRQLAIARTEDPSSALLLSWISYGYYLERRTDSALVESRRALDNDPRNLTSLVLGALVRVESKLPREALELAGRVPEGGVTARWYVIGKLGDPVDTRRRLDSLERSNPRQGGTQFRRAYFELGVGDTARALEALDRATDNGEIWHNLVAAADPVFDRVRGSAHFDALLRRVGLPASVARPPVARP